MPVSAHLPPMLEGDVWTEKAVVIRHLYLSERKTLRQVKDILETEHGFPIFPLSIYETRIRDKLRLRKKLKRTDWPIVYRHVRDREGKETGIYLNGARIAWERAWKEIRRSGARSISHIGHPDPLPDGVVVRTPSPVMRSMSRAFPGRQDSLHSVFSPPAPASLVVQNGALNIGLQSHPHFSNLPADSTPSNFHDLSLVHSASQTASQGSTMAGPHNSEILFYRSFLQTTPWSQFQKKIRSILGSGNPEPPNGRFFDDDIAASYTCLLPSSLAHLIVQVDATPLPRPSGKSAAPALNFSACYFITKFLQLLSNKTVTPLPSPDICRNISELFDILLGRLPNEFLLKLFESDLPTMRAAWEASVPLALPVDHEDAFSLLMKVGLQHPDWILVDGHRYLSYAVSMGRIDIVRGLLAMGVRADDALSHAMTPPAILAAAIAEYIDCVKELIEGCDVNRIIKYTDESERASNFGIFVAAVARGKFAYWRRKPADAATRAWGYIDISLDKGIYSLVLDTFLNSGADVDLLWRGDRSTAIYKLHDANDIPMEWNLTLLEQSFYWDSKLYDRLKPYSAKRGVETTRLGICLSARRGKEFLRAYLDSRPSQHPADRTKLLQLILAEQFLLEDYRVIHLEIIRGLVDLGVDINLPHLSLDCLTAMTSSKNSSLLLYSLVKYSLRQGFTEDFSKLIALLVSRGATIDSTAIRAGVTKDGLGVLPELAEHGADIRRQGGLALCTAARWNNFEAVSWLLQAGVDINADIFRMSWEMPRTTIVVASDATFNCCYAYEYRCHFRECGSWGPANSEMLGYLIQRGAKLRYSSQDPSRFHFLKAVLSTTALDFLLLEKMELFLEFVAIPEDLATTNETLLELCLVRTGPARPIDVDEHRYQGLAVYELLLRRGCPVLRESGLALYIYYGGRHEIIYKILDAGADINACSRGGDNNFRSYPLQAAAMRADLELVKKLLQRGAIINQPPLGFRGRTALQGACEWEPLSIEERTRKMDLIRLLINKGADVNALAAQSHGMTALQIAALYGDMEVALLLLEHGANANAPPAEVRGYCALNAAARSGRLDLVKLLLNTAAHSHHRGQSGYEGAIALATKYDHFAVVDLIREHIKLFGHCIIVDLDGDEGFIF